MLQASAEMCSKYALSLYLYGAIERSKEWANIADVYWQRWITGSSKRVLQGEIHEP
jgi:hypothetical protein